MRQVVENPNYYKNKFILKANERHNSIYDYSKVEYVNSIEKVEVICNDHGSFFVRPDAHVRKVGCPSCNGGIKYTRETFILKSIEKHNNKYDYSKVNYFNSTNKVEIICNDHGSFSMSPSNHLIGQCCPSCSGVRKKTNIDFISISNRVHNNKYDYSQLSYINNRTKVKIICKSHGEFTQNPKDHMNGRGCNLCNISRGESMISDSLISIGVDFIREYKFDTCVSLNGTKLPFDFYLPKYKLLIEYDGRQHYEAVDKFGGVDSHEKLVKNDILRDEWCLKNGIRLIRIRWDNVKDNMSNLYEILSENDPDKSSSLEYLEKSKFDLELYLSRKDEFIDFITNRYRYEIYHNYKVDGYTCDIFIPKYKIGFNFLGLFKNSDKNVDKNIQTSLYNKIKNKDYKIINIFEDQWSNKKDIIKSRISTILGDSIKIFARKCEIREISDNKLIRKFLIDNHIQGFLGSKVKLGLYHDDKLVSLMTFGNLRKNLGLKSKDGSFELLRFCNILNTSVVGGASKLFKYFIKVYKPHYITSYADKMWSNTTNMYEKIGMSYIRESKPSYFYIVGNKRKGRFDYRKDKLISYGFDKNLSEYEICKMCGINRIYDCGTIKYDWTN